MHKPILLFLDWDSTLTTTSTVPLLLSLSPYPPSTTPSELSALYAFAFAAHSSSYAPTASPRTTLTEEITYLNNLRDIERASIERCEQAGVWRGVTWQIVEDAAEKAIREGSVVLREGAERLIEEVLKRRGRVVVLSVAWSGRFISGCLRTAFGKKAEAVEVRANEIEEHGKLSRYFRAEGNGIWTCGDKARVLKEVVHEAKEVKTIYVGDSVTDLQCLTSVDVGISMGDESNGSELRELRRTLERLGVECQWVENSKASQDRSGVAKEQTGLWWADDFHDICNSAIYDK